MTATNGTTSATGNYYQTTKLPNYQTTKLNNCQTTKLPTLPNHQPPTTTVPQQVPGRGRFCGQPKRAKELDGDHCANIGRLAHEHQPPRPNQR